VATHLDIDLTWRGRTAVLTLGGAVDLYTAHLLEGRVVEAAADGATDLHVDLTGLRFIDSSGLGALIEAHHRLPGRVSVSGASGLVLRVLEAAATAPALNAEGRSLAWVFAPTGVLTN
jgi:anti-anti-sigma factor